MKLNKIILGDCIEGMSKLNDNSADICIIDPPYNLSKGSNINWDSSNKIKGFGGDWKKVMEEWDDLPLMDYLKFCLTWLIEVKRVVKPEGSIWIHGTYHNIGIINFCLQILHIEIINEIIWYKRNSFPNLRARRLTASHETIIWAHTGNKRQYNFNYDLVKSIDYPEDNLKKQGKQLRTVWDIPNNKTKKELIFGKHPTQKPLRLINRMLDVCARKNDIVLVPFCGSGSECVAAAMRGLDFIAFEINQEYYDLAQLRIKSIFDQRTLNI